MAFGHSGGDTHLIGCRDVIHDFCPSTILTCPPGARLPVTRKSSAHLRLGHYFPAVARPERHVDVHVDAVGYRLGAAISANEVDEARVEAAKWQVVIRHCFRRTTWH